MTKVERDQFRWDGERLCHLPTGARFHKRSAIVNRGRSGDVLEDGRCYDWEDVYQVAHELILEAHAG